MRIPKEDIKLFFKLHPALLQYVNQRLQIFPEIKTPKALQRSGVENIAQVREKLWGQLSYIDDFLAENPDNFSKAECAIIARWRQAVIGKFYVFRHLKQYSIFLTETEPVKAYGVRSLNTSLHEMFQRVPVYTEATLIPLRDHIIYDGILRPYPVMFGPGFRFDLNEVYREAKEKHGITTTIGTR